VKSIFFGVCAALVFSADCFAKDYKCVQTSELKNSMTPVELYLGVSDCIKADKYEDAVMMFLTAGVYGRFDTFRVTDKSAHQAVGVLKMYSSYGLSEKQQAKFSEFAGEMFTGEKHEKICQEVRRIGKPSYYPDYMINHGLNAGSPTPIVPNFDSEKEWGKALSTYLRCK